MQMPIMAKDDFMRPLWPRRPVAVKPQRRLQLHSPRPAPFKDKILLNMSIGCEGITGSGGRWCHDFALFDHHLTPISKTVSGPTMQKTKKQAERERQKHAELHGQYRSIGPAAILAAVLL